MLIWIVIARAPVEFLTAQPVMDLLVDAVGARIAHVAHRRHQGAAAIETGVIDAPGVDSDGHRRSADVRRGAPQAFDHLVAKSKGVPSQRGPARVGPLAKR